MTNTSQMSERKDRLVKALIFFLALFVLFLVLNISQLYSAWAVWSDNFLVTTQPRRGWKLAPAMDLYFQDGGEKQFRLGSI